MGPAVASSRAAESRTDRVMQFSLSRAARIETPKLRRPPDIRDRVGFMPNTPQHEAGTRIEPPLSLPFAIGTIRVATAAAAPPLEPPGVRSVSHGLRVGPSASGSVVGCNPNSGRLVLPQATRPAALYRRVSSPSAGAM